MQAQAVTKYARISPFKCREVTRAIQGRSVNAALALVSVANKKAAGLVKATLVSALANAKAQGASQDDLVVKLAVVGEGPTMKRFMPRARGSAGRIRKRSSHIQIVLSNEA